MGLLDLLTPEKQLQAAHADINSAWTALCELARKRDIPHEVFEIIGKLRETAAQEFSWYEKVPTLRPTPMTIDRLKAIAADLLKL